MNAAATAVASARERGGGARVEVTRGSMHAVTVERGPPIDGTLDSPVWQRCPPIELGDTLSRAPGPFRTTARVLFDETRLYVAFDCEEPDTDGLVRNVAARDGNVWEDDSVELFVTGDRREGVFQFIVNSTGTLFDSRNFGSAGSGKDLAWTSSAVVRTSVEPGKRWIATMSVPLAEIGAHVGENQTWIMNLNRNRPADGKKVFKAGKAKPAADVDHAGMGAPKERLPPRPKGVTREVASRLATYSKAASLIADTEEALEMLREAQGLLGDVEEPERSRAAVDMYARFLRESPETPLAHKVLARVRTILEFPGVLEKPRSGLVAHWRFDESPPATTAADSSGRGNDATVHGNATWLPTGGIVLGALDLDGKGAYVDVPDSVIFAPEGTICGWIRPDDPRRGQRVFATDWQPCKWYVWLGTSVLSANIGGSARFGRGKVSGGAWHHFAVTWVSGGPGVLYLDGVKVGSRTLGDLQPPARASIGAYNEGTSSFFDGMIDDFRVYERALAPEEIGTLGGRGLKATRRVAPAAVHSLQTGLVAHWKFEEGSGGTAHDSSGNGFHAKFGKHDDRDGPRWVPGKTGGALEFDGRDDCLGIGHDPRLDPECLTVAAWLAPSPSEGPGQVFSKCRQYKSGFYGLVVDGLRMRAGAWLHVGGKRREAWSADDSLGADRWSHAAVTYDGADLVVYVDGAPAGRENVGLVRTGSDSSPTIGREGAGYPFIFNYAGRVDDLRLYGRALSPDEVAALAPGGGGEVETARFDTETTDARHHDEEALPLQGDASTPARAAAVAFCESLMDEVDLGRDQRRHFYRAFAPSVRHWKIVGYFDSPEAHAAGAGGGGGPRPGKSPVDLAATYRVPGREDLAWRDAETSAEHVYCRSSLATFREGDEAAGATRDPPRGGERTGRLVAYLYTRFLSPRHQRAVLFLGCEGSSAVWVNGKRPHAFLETSAAAPRGLAGRGERDETRVGVLLRKGLNDVLLETVAIGGTPRVSARLADRNGRPVEGLVAALPATVTTVGALSSPPRGGSPAPVGGEDGEPTAVTVAFARPVAGLHGRSWAEDVSTYAADRGVVVEAAELSPEGDRVTLRTTKLARGTEYRLAVRHATGGDPPRGGERAPAFILPVTLRTFYVAVRGMGTGLRGEYYDNKDFTDLKFTRVDPGIDFDWDRRAAPHQTAGLQRAGTRERAVAARGLEEGIGNDEFSVRWTGRIEPMFPGRYTFHTYTDDGVKLWVDGRLLIDDWEDGFARAWSASVDFAGGRTYPIRIDYYEGKGKAMARLMWSSGGHEKQVVPRSQLYPPGAAPDDATDVRPPSGGAPGGG